MKILITGGAGYIGSHTIIEILENTNWEVISIDNYSSSSEKTYQRIEKITGKKVTYYNIDLTDLSLTEKVFAENTDIAGIIHFAAFKSVPESVENPLMYYHNNLNSLINILKCQAKYNIPNLIFSSSCSVYGNLTELPVTETTPLNKPESPYAYTKQIGEKMVDDFIKTNANLKAISLRYFNPVGAHKSGLNGEVPIARPNNLVPYITQTAIGKLEQLTVFGGDYATNDGTCIRDYVHVCDIASAHVKALQKLVDDKNFEQHSIINLGTGVGVSVLEAIKAFEKVSNQKLNYKIGPRRAGDVEAIYANNTKAKELINWTPKFNIDEMMLSAWLWEQNLNKM
ncbi:MAG: UDP-glucose 4-epimerase GalE [Flavobacteriales bacterium]|nr:UDP-glucose 4-epimerase GalE [Flavobacteriales bacterium]MCL4857050.1 UDP-glucose 4-epimerase GalE [Flavobacteriales bacterium]